jgi:hypothetical protein
VKGVAATVPPRAAAGVRPGADDMAIADHRRSEHPVAAGNNAVSELGG